MNMTQWNNKAKGRGVSIATVLLLSIKKSRHWRRRSLLSVLSGELLDTSVDAARRTRFPMVVEFLLYNLF